MKPVFSNRFAIPLLVLLFFSSGFMSSEMEEKGHENALLEGYAALKGDFLWVSRTEVTNKEYREFTEWLRINDSSAWSEMLPDTQVWNPEGLQYGEPFQLHYFSHPAFHQFPVFGVNYYQAKAYCRWKSERLMESPAFKNSEFANVIVRLPTEKEWTLAARGSRPENAMWPWEGTSVRVASGKYKGLIQANIRLETGLNYYKLSPNTVNVENYWPNTTGIYNAIGNVSEWVDEGKAMGGSWNDFPYNASLLYPYPELDKTTASGILGFRCVIEVLDYKKEIQSKLLKLRSKTIEKEFYLVRSDSAGGLYAARFETSNRWFNTFISEIGDTGIHVKNENWGLFTPYQSIQAYGWHPAFDDFPVVNIRHRDAVAYCCWLTDKYHTMPKRKFKKVEFRLPTEEEWEYAASGGRHERLYPWGGPYYMNSLGDYLANFCPLEEQYLSSYDTTGGVTIWPAYRYPNGDFTISRSADGAEFTCSVQSHFPNDFGLYQCAGNVSEMLINKNKCKGGNWNSQQSELFIATHTKYTDYDPTIGFRVFMEVIER